MDEYIKIRIIGTVKEISKDTVVINNDGELIKVLMMEKEVQSLSIGQEVKLTLRVYYDFDSIKVLGYINEELYNFVNQFTQVSGVGFKGADAIYTVLSSKGISRSDICFEISNGNSDLIATVPGIGSRTAYHIVDTLKTKVKSFEKIDLNCPGIEKYSDIINELESLGFIRKDIVKVMETISISEGMDNSDIIQLVIQNM